MYQSAIRGLGNVDPARKPRLEANCARRAYVGAGPATLTGQGIHGIGSVAAGDGPKSAGRLTRPTCCTRLDVDHGDLRALVADCFLHLGLEEEVEVGRIHVAVSKHRVVGQRGEGGDNGRLPSTSFAGDHNEFGHGARGAAWRIPS